MPVANDTHPHLLRHVRSRRRWVGVCGASVLTVITTASATWASTSGTLRISGYVPARASVGLSQWYFSPLSARLSVKSNRLRLGDMTVAGNNKLFTVSLVSRNQSITGKTSLIDESSGNAVPYRLLYGGAEVPFDNGVARLADSLTDVEPGAKPLELDVPSAAPTNGHYREDLVLIIRAR